MNHPHVVFATTLAFASVVGTATASPIEYAYQDRFVSVAASDQPGPPYAREDRTLITGEFGSDLLDAVVQHRPDETRQTHAGEKS